MLRMTNAAIIFVVLASACTPKSVLYDGDLDLPNGQILRRASLRTWSIEGQRTIVLSYHTGLSAVDCNGLQAEARKLWADYLRDQANRNSARVAQIVPKDSSGVSVGFVFAKDEQGTWQEKNFGRCE